MAEYLVSPGIKTSETDKSAIAARPLVAGAALIGPTARGPVNVPTKVTSYGDYQRRFGITFTLVSGSVKMEQEYLTSLAAKSYFEQGGESILVVRVASGSWESAHSTDIVLKGKGVLKHDVERQVAGSETITHPEFTVKEVDPVSGYLSKADIKLDATTSFEATFDADHKFQHEETIDAQSVQVTYTACRVQDEAYPVSNSFILRSIGQGATLNGAASATYREYVSGSESDERKDESLILGTKDNFRFEISDVDEEKGTFSLVIRRGDDTANEKIVLEQFTNLSLDPNSANYIAKQIGDQHATMKTDDEGLPYIDVEGQYTNKSAYVYVDVVKPTLNYLASDGVTVNSDPAGISFKYYLPAEQRGAFIGGSGSIEYSDKFYEKIDKTVTEPQGVPISEYDNAINLLYNQDEYEINVISVPGLIGSGVASAQVSNVVSLASTRGDCISVVDLEEADASTKQVAEAASSQNSSYAAAYYPWLQMYNSCGRLVWVPASVVIPGVYVYNDHAAAPWFAPAGMTRGGIQGVTQTKKKLTKAHRDTLYAKNVNPIATLPGAGIVIYGQKTLQKKASALDRINVRRLLIELKKKVKDMASPILFEQNSAATRNSFRAKLEPYLESVVQRQGLYAYKVVIDELNDADTIDRNEFRCQIYIQPTKVIEFIYIDFTVTATGVEFNS